MNQDIVDWPLSAPDIEGHGRFGACVVCEQDLPLRLPRDGEQGTSWICAGCGATYHAVFDKGASADLARNVRPANVTFDRNRLVQPPQAVAAFVRQMQEDGCGRGDRRSAVRRWMVACVAAVPVDKGYQPIGEPFMAVTSNISTHGLAMVHTRAVESDLLVVELSAPSGPVMQLVMRVARCRPLGRFYEVAGPFVLRMT